jgi:hypothetical protein
LVAWTVEKMAVTMVVRTAALMVEMKADLLVVGMVEQSVY